MAAHLVKKSQIRRKLNMPVVNKSQSAHIQKILESYEQKHISEPHRNVPMDSFLRFYFLDHKKEVDSLDREKIVDHVYTLQRWKGYLDAICRRPQTWESRLRSFASLDFDNQLQNANLPQFCKSSVPEDLFDMLQINHGDQKAKQLCNIMLEKPRLTVRANTIRTTQTDLLYRFRQLGFKC